MDDVTAEKGHCIQFGVPSEESADHMQLLTQVSKNSC